MEQFILISLDTMARPATQAEKDAFKTIYNASEVVGMYKGQVESSFKVDYKHFESMLAVALRFKQESILVVDGQQIALVYPDTLKHNKIGESFRMSNVEPEDVNSWSLIDGVYYYV